MTEKRFIFNGNSNTIEYDGKSILLDSYGEKIEDLLNEQETIITEQKKYLTQMGQGKHLKTIIEQKERIKELEEENGRMKGAFKRKFDYDIEDVVDEICDEDW